MRKVTKEAVSAFNRNKSKVVDNTQIIANGAITGMYLFGNLIAEKNIDSKTLKITNAGYFTNTTKERLNGLPGVSIRQKNRQWFLNGELWDGKWKSINL
jgi:ribosomal protein S17E